MYNQDEWFIQFKELSEPAMLDQHDNYLALDSAFSKLSRKDQFIVALITAGYTRIEGDRIVGITRNAVGKRYTRAINLLRSILQEDFGFNGIP